MTTTVFSRTTGRAVRRVITNGGLVVPLAPDEVELDGDFWPDHDLVIGSDDQGNEVLSARPGAPDAPQGSEVVLNQEGDDPRWEVVPTLAAAQTRSVSVAKLCRADLTYGPITVDGMTFDVCQSSMVLVMAKVHSMTLTGEKTARWTLADDRTVDVPLVTFNRVITAFSARADAVHRSWRETRERVRSASHRDEAAAAVSAGLVPSLDLSHRVMSESQEEKQ